MTKIEVFQSDQIGGCVTVITANRDGKIHRIMIDYGKSLPGSPKEDFSYPWDREPVDAVFFTHYHGDHVGRLAEIPESIPLYMGETARKVLMNIHQYLSSVPGPEGEIHRKTVKILQNNNRVHTFLRKSIKEPYLPVMDIPFFSIEPYSVDHSAYDAYMFLIEVEDETKKDGKKVILHTGDFRSHGRQGKALLKIIDFYIHKNRSHKKVTKGRKHNREVDVLIMEGTMITRDSEWIRTEEELYREAVEYLKKHKYVFLICSSTNLDSLASFYKAWQTVSSPYKGYMYTYSKYYTKQLKTFSRTAGLFTGAYRFDNVYTLNLDKTLFLSHGSEKITQKSLMEEYGFLAVIKPQFFCEEYIDAFIEQEEKPVIIYSMWEGYLDRNHKAYNKEWDEFLEIQKVKGVEVKCLHTSGHASVKTLEEVIRAVEPKEELIPIHTESREAFRKLDIPEEIRKKIRK